MQGAPRRRTRACIVAGRGGTEKPSRALARLLGVRPHPGDAIRAFSWERRGGRGCQRFVAMSGGEVVVGGGFPASSPSHTEAGQDNLYVKNVPKMWKTRDLTSCFSLAGRVKACRVFMAESRAGALRIGLVQMSSADEAQRAIQQLDGFLPEGSEVPLSVQFAKNKCKRKARTTGSVVFPTLLPQFPASYAWIGHPMGNQGQEGLAYSTVGGPVPQGMDAASLDFLSPVPAVAPQHMATMQTLMDLQQLQQQQQQFVAMQHAGIYAPMATPGLAVPHVQLGLNASVWPSDAYQLQMHLMGSHYGSMAATGLQGAMVGHPAMAQHQLASAGHAAQLSHPPTAARTEDAPARLDPRVPWSWPQQDGSRQTQWAPLPAPADGTPLWIRQSPPPAPGSVAAGMQQEPNRPASSAGGPTGDHGASDSETTLEGLLMGMDRLEVSKRAGTSGTITMPPSTRATAESQANRSQVSPGAVRRSLEAASSSDLRAAIAKEREAGNSGPLLEALQGSRPRPGS